MRIAFKSWSLKTMFMVQFLVAGCLAATLCLSWKDYETPRRLLDAGATPRHAATYFVSNYGNIGIMGDSIVDPESEETYLSAEEVSGVFVEDKNWDKQEVFRLLRWLPILEFLSLENLDIDDNDIKYLSRLRITMLLINGTEVTDQGLMDLAPNKTLKQIWIRRTSITQKGREQFQQLRPDVQLHHWF